MAKFLSGKLSVPTLGIALAFFLSASLVYRSLLPISAFLAITTIAVCPLIFLAIIRMYERFEFGRKMLEMIGIGLVLVSIVVAVIGSALIYLAGLRQSSPIAYDIPQSPTLVAKTFFLKYEPNFQRKLTPIEAETLVAGLNILVRTANAMVDLPVPKSAFAMQGERWPEELLKHGYSATINELKQYKFAIQSLSREFEEKVDHYSDFGDELSSIIGRLPTGSLGQTLDVYVKALELMEVEPPNISPWVVANALYERQNAALRAIQNLRAWAKAFSNQRVPDARKAIQKAFLSQIGGSAPREKVIISNP
jgi:hypothetical protein